MRRRASGTTTRSRSPTRSSAAAKIACGETCARRLSRPKLRGSWPCSPSEYASREKPEIDVVTAASRISAPVSADVERAARRRAATAARGPSRSATPSSGARIQVVPSSVFGPGKAETRDERDRDVDRDDRRDRAEDRPRQVDARAPGLLGEVRNRLEAGEREHRERERERDRVPGRMRAEVHAAASAHAARRRT